MSANGRVEKKGKDSIRAEECVEEDIATPPPTVSKADLKKINNSFSAVMYKLSSTFTPSFSTRNAFCSFVSNTVRTHRMCANGRW